MPKPTPSSTCPSLRAPARYCGDACRRLLNLVRLYGREDVLAAIDRAIEYQTYDAAYVETFLLQERRRRELPSPMPVRPRRQELIEEVDLDEPDPGDYDRFCHDNENNEEKTSDE